MNFKRDTVRAVEIARALKFDIDNIFSAIDRNQLPRMPKGATLYRKKGRPGESTDRGVVRCKSKGRTGARMRLALLKDPRTKEIRLPKRHRGRLYR